MSAHHEAWRAIVDSADQPAAVARHLGVLTASDECRAPYDGPDGEVPASMLAVARVHNGVGWEYGGGGGIGFNGVSQGGVAYGPQLLRLMVQDILGRPMFAAFYS